MEHALKPNVVLSVVRSNQQEWCVMAEDVNEPLPPPLPDDEIDPEDHPNAVPDPWHDTRAVHGDSGARDE